MAYTVFSIVYWLFMAVSCIVFFAGAVLVWLLTSWNDRRQWLQHRFSCLWGSFYIWMNPLWKLQIEGREKIDESKVYVAVSNHQSMLDILIIHALFFHFKWVSKKENLYIPFVGWNMILNRYVVVDRSSRKSFLRMMRDCRRHINYGSSIMIFPEGSRSSDGELRNFKDGAFRLAHQMKVAVLPIVLDGSWKAIERKSFVVRRKTTIKVRVLDPVMPEEFDGMEPRETASKVKALIDSALQEIRKSG
jgi:1-acyl-sn-glycerol-3-phosphate acyltransferase